MNIKERTNAYEKLVEKRKRFRFSDVGLTNPSQTEFDVNEIEPWAQWQNNLEAKILLVGQEYSDLETYIKTQGKVERYKGIYKYSTNENINKNFKILGFDIGHPSEPNKSNPIFFTNAVMGLKSPPMSANFDKKWLSESREEFLRPLIKIINPSIILAMGEMATRTLGVIFDYKFSTQNEMIENGPFRKDNTLIFPLMHAGGLGLANRPTLKQIQDWKRIKKVFKNSIKPFS